MSRLGALFLLVLASGTASAQTPEPIAEVVRDADGDRVPDRVGAVVTVAGRTPADAGAFGAKPAAAPLYVQDATAGLPVNAPDVRVAAGDSVVATGRLSFYAGAAFLDSARVEVVPAPRRIPEPVRYPVATPEAVEGRLVVVEGRVVGRSQVGAGEALMLSLDDLSLVVAFVFEGRAEPISLDAYAPGDRLRVVGVAGQYDRAEPFVDSYQIYPRASSDITRAGVPEAAYRWAALAALVLLTVVVVVALWLRAQVRRRVAALRASEERYKTLVDRASEGIFVHDLDGRNVEMNRAARRLLGLAEGDAIDSMVAIVAPESVPFAHEHAEALARDRHSQADLAVARPDGSRGLLGFESQVVDLEGGPRVLSLARDIEAQRTYEQGLIEAREQAIEMARIKSAFLASMSHEIRTPLTAVIGFAELLLDEVDDESRGLVEAIGAGGQRLLTTLNSVLDLARLDAEREVLRPQQVDAVAHIERTMSLLRPLAEERGLSLTVTASPQVVPAVLDAGALDRVLTNLVGNAVKFTDRGGVTVEIDGDPSDLVIRVLDTGIGIGEAFLPELFTEFRQASEGDGRSHEGTGLGLAITKRLVELMGGSISVESTWGVGTAFTVVLPRGLEAASGDGALPEADLAAA
ncbi:MAG: PAS domain-containing sensor histidine kinase [Bacteroidota bacterium]